MVGRIAGVLRESAGASSFIIASHMGWWVAEARWCSPCRAGRSTRRVAAPPRRRRASTLPRAFGRERSAARSAPYSQKYTPATEPVEVVRAEREGLPASSRLATVASQPWKPIARCVRGACGHDEHGRRRGRLSSTTGATQSVVGNRRARGYDAKIETGDDLYRWKWQTRKTNAAGRPGRPSRRSPARRSTATASARSTASRVTAVRFRCASSRGTPRRGRAGPQGQRARPPQTSSPWWASARRRTRLRRGAPRRRKPPPLDHRRPPGPQRTSTACSAPCSRACAAHHVSIFHAAPGLRQRSRATASATSTTRVGGFGLQPPRPPPPTLPESGTPPERPPTTRQRPTPRADAYAFGVLLVECPTGSSPPAGEPLTGASPPRLRRAPATASGEAREASREIPLGLAAGLARRLTPPRAPRDRARPRPLAPAPDLGARGSGRPVPASSTDRQALARRPTPRA